NSHDSFDLSNKVVTLDIWDKDRTINIVRFEYFYIKIKYLPLITKQPENKTFSSGENDTLFKVIFDNEVQEDIHITLFYLKTLDSQPKEIEKTLAEYGMWYRYIKDVTFSDEGYYFARVSNSPCDTISTDTIKVTVIPKGIAAGVNENGIEPYFSIHPNPASDFITIPELNNGLQPIVHKVQIFDVLGIEVMSVETGLDQSQQRIDISHLPAGVYF